MKLFTKKTKRIITHGFIKNMKKATAEEITIVECPYKKCGHENHYYHTSFQEDDIEECERCNKEFKITFE